LLLFTHIAPLRAFIEAKKLKGNTIGLVPTMGALHNGHISLIGQSKAQTDITISSIFVNPTQFNNKEDLLKYPRTIETDIIKLAQADCDVLFHPAADEMYPNGQSTQNYNWGAVTHSLEGAFRPGHFDGVITIVKRLFDIVTPDKAFFGQKDFQQCAVIRQMVKEFNMPLEIIVADTLREEDGLAMSSRNTRLTTEERVQALLVSKALFYMQKHAKQLRVPDLISAAKQILNEGHLLKVEYLEIVDAQTLEPATILNPFGKYVALIALWCGNVRLIDNMPLGD
jgi:pantoate--beta-alanine ligase